MKCDKISAIIEPQHTKAPDMWNDPEFFPIGPGDDEDDEEVYEDDPDDDEDDFDDLDEDDLDDEDETDDEVDHFYDGDGKLIHDTFDDEE